MQVPEESTKKCGAIIELHVIGRLDCTDAPMEGANETETQRRRDVSFEFQFVSRPLCHEISVPAGSNNVRPLPCVQTVLRAYRSACW